LSHQSGQSLLGGQQNGGNSWPPQQQEASHAPIWPTRFIVKSACRAPNRRNWLNRFWIASATLGSFVLRSKGLRVGRNPKTGVEVPIEPRTVLTFRPSQLVREAINK
jgi:hypothetical protein